MNFDIKEPEKGELHEMFEHRFDDILHAIYDELYELNVTKNTYRIVYKADGKHAVLPNTGVLSDVIEEAAFHYIQPEDREIFLDFFSIAAIRNFFAIENSNRIGDFRKRWADGVYRWTNLTMYKGRVDKTNRDEIYFCFVTDISEKKEREVIEEKNRILTVKQEETDRYRILLESTNAMTFNYDVEKNTMCYTVVDENRDRTEHQVENYLGNLPWSKAMHPDFLLSCRQKVTDLIKTGGEGSYEMKADFFGNGYRWYRCDYVSMKNNQKKVYSILGTINDISDMKNLFTKNTELLEIYNFAITNAFDYISVVDVATGMYNVSRPGGQQHGGVPDIGMHDEMILFTATNYVGVGEQQAFKTNMLLPGIQENLKKQDGGYVYYYHLKSNDCERWKETKYTYFSKTEDRILISTRDITEQRKAQKMAMDEERRSRKMLKEALLAAESSNRAKSDFLSRMSHDIRTPMNAIIGMTDIAKAMIDDQEKVTDCINKIGASAAFLLDLINDILDMSKIESGKMVLAEEEFIFAHFLEGIEVIISDQAKAKELGFVVNVDERIARTYIGDQLRVKQVLMNLLSNAFKFTEPGGNILLTVELVKQFAVYDELQCTVSDTGIGMSDETMKRLFNPFEQGTDQIQHHYGGSGLGLAIASNIVHMMNGEITVTSKVGEGSKFVVTLHLKRSGKGGTMLQSDIGILKEENREEKQFAGQKILLVEDNELNQEIAKTLLEMRNLNVEIANNGQQALDFFSSKPLHYYSAVLMDIRMPIKDGLTASREIRNLDRQDAATIPIIAMSANAFTEDVQKSYAAGMNAHISKPIDLNELYKHLGNLII